MQDRDIGARVFKGVVRDDALHFRTQMKAPFSLTWRAQLALVDQYVQEVCGMGPNAACQRKIATLFLPHRYLQLQPLVHAGALRNVCKERVLTSGDHQLRPFENQLNSESERVWGSPDFNGDRLIQEQLLLQTVPTSLVLGEPKR